MRIYVRTNEGMKFWIPVPFWVLSLCTGKFIESIIIKHVPKEQRIYWECIDFSKLRKAVRVLKEYKGLEIVDVKAGDGTVVNIKL